MSLFMRVKKNRKCTFEKTQITTQIGRKIYNEKENK